ncbi:DNA adenine methylase [Candidatus Skiveiella danica]|uniref:DNA adenine methylase n=1 Tax=Candidatus Skiveiella danica TaxID=3386177 RepID=UPI0039B9926A
MADLSSLFSVAARCFFAVHPTGGIIADSNPELVNLYRSVATDVDGVMAQLRRHENTKRCFMPFERWMTKLSNVEAAASTIFLNRTCFNGLYRVNKSPQFNVPFGRYKNPKIIDEDA